MAALTLLQGVDIGTALDALPVGAAVAVAILWTKVHRLEKDRETDVKADKERAEQYQRLEVTLGELKVTLKELKNVVGSIVRVDVIKQSQSSPD